MTAAAVSVPASSANLGPGFDCLGVALGVYLEVRFTPSHVSEITGRGRQRSVKDSLIFRSYQAAFRAAEAEPADVKIEVLQSYPSAKGMGASASAIVAGLVGARALGGLDLSTEALAELAVEIEGHADNVLPALLGGLVLTVGDGWSRLAPSEKVAPLVLVAASGYKTEEARKVVPRTIAVEDAVANTSAAAALVLILSGHSDPSGLMDATADRIHEPFRLPLMPESHDLHLSLRARGIATALSGAGPSLICLVPSEQIQDAAQTAQDLLPQGWALLRPGWDLRGARVTRPGP